MSAGLAYHYFASKEELFHELVTLALDISLNVYETAHSSPGTAWERLVRLVSNVVPAAYRGLGSLFFLVMIQSQTYLNVPQATRDLIARRVPRYNAVLIDLIEKAQAEGSARDGDPAAFANAINGIIQGLAVLNASSPGVQMPDPETILRMVQV